MTRIPPEKLGAFLGPRADAPPPARIPYPPPAGVLYVGPNPDGSRKMCGNCWKWITTGGCMEVAGDIGAEMVCGLHTFGKPQPAVLVMEPLRKMLGPDVGLIPTPASSGTSCDRCRFYVPEENDSVSEEIGLCNALGAGDGLPPVLVDARGCCARWEGR